MDLHKMQYFKDVYELNSFTKAANKNFVYQSAVTQQIASIEKELGVLLFEREHGNSPIRRQGTFFIRSAGIYWMNMNMCWRKLRITHRIKYRSRKS